MDLRAIELRQHGQAHLAGADQERLAGDVDHIERATRLERHACNDVEEVCTTRSSGREESAQDTHGDERGDADSAEHHQRCHQQVAITRRLATTRHADHVARRSDTQNA